MIRRILRTELLRGSAPVAGVATLIAGGWLMYWRATTGLNGWTIWYGLTSSYNWPGRWMSFAEAIWQSLYVLGPVAVAAGAWQAGRQKRRRVHDQLRSAPRPAWQPLVVSWASLTAAILIGLLIVVLAGAAFVAPIASYHGGPWLLVLAVSIPALAAMTAVGFALGILVPSRLTAPVAAIATWVVQWRGLDDAWMPFPASHSWHLLAPALSPIGAGGGQHPVELVSVAQFVWFASIAVTLLVVVSARRRWFALGPAIAAGAAAVVVLSVDQPLATDDSARELVCTGEQPQVCLSRVDAFVLDDAAATVRKGLAHFDGVDGGPSRVSPGVDDVDLSVSQITLTGELRPSSVHWQWIWLVTEHKCDTPAWMVGVAESWTHSVRPSGPREVHEEYEALLSLPVAGQKAWMGDFIAATEACDREELDRLATQLR